MELVDYNFVYYVPTTLYTNLIYHLAKEIYIYIYIYICVRTCVLRPCVGVYVCVHF